MVDMKSMPKYGYERDLGLGCRLLGGSKQSCRRQCRPLRQKKKQLWAPVQAVTRENIAMGATIKPKKNKNPKSIIKWGSTQASLSPFSFSSCFVLLSACFVFFRVAVLLFVLLLSSSPYYYALLALYFPSHGYSLHVITLFVLLLSSLPYFWTCNL